MRRYRVVSENGYLVKAGLPENEAIELAERTMERHPDIEIWVVSEDTGRAISYVLDGPDL